MSAPRTATGNAPGVPGAVSSPASRLAPPGATTGQVPDGGVRAGAPAVVSRQVWFGPDERPLHGWLSAPASGLVGAGVVLCPPMGEEGRACHRAFRRLAEEVAAAGMLALRLDYDGTGDSAGAQDDPDRVGAWVGSIAAGRALLAELGVSQVAVVGMRLGATLAAAQAVRDDAPPSALVLWDPCLSGRTFLREGEALYAFSEGTEDGLPGQAPDDGWRHTPGFQYDAATARALRGLDLARLPASARLAGRVLLLTREDRPVAQGILDRVLADPAPTTLEPALDQERLLDELPSDNHVPERALRRVVDWLAAGAATPHAIRPLPLERRALVPSAGVGSPPVVERAVHLGPAGVYGVVTEPVAPVPATQPWVVQVNVAAEHHIGPGRRWVEQARAWAALGYRSVRIDHTGIGDSPTRPGQMEDEPFTPQWIDDMRDIVAELGADGAPVAMMGLCSGSQSAFEAALWTDVAAVFGANPRLTLYHSGKGSPTYTPVRRGAIVPPGWLSRLAVGHRRTAGGLWRVYRQFAVWRSPYVVLPRVLRRGTMIHICSCRQDAKEFTEVVFWRPALWWRRRHDDLILEIDDAFDHSLLTRRGQRRYTERATEFLHRVHDRARREAGAVGG